MQTALKAGNVQIIGGKRMGAAPCSVPRAAALPARTLRQNMRTAAIANPSAVPKETVEKCVNAIRFLAIDGE